MMAQLHRYLQQTSTAATMTPTASPLWGGTPSSATDALSPSLMKAFGPSGLPFSALPSSAPIVLNVAPVNIASDVSIFRFLIYLIMTMGVLGFIVYLNQKDSSLGTTRRAGITTATAAARNDATTNSQQEVDLVKSMTPDERKDYVTSFLKSQKFVDKDNSTQTGSSSFRITQSSSFRINDVKNEDDIESNHPLGGMHQTSCAICLDRFKDGEDICSAQNKLCPHEFHLECIFPWLLKSQDCPCCRRDYLTVEADASELAGDAATNATTTSVNSS